jgi:hypothetical protein
MFAKNSAKMAILSQNMYSFLVSKIDQIISFLKVCGMQSESRSNEKPASGPYILGGGVQGPVGPESVHGESDDLPRRLVVQVAVVQRDVVCRRQQHSIQCFHI